MDDPLYRHDNSTSSSDSAHGGTSPRTPTLSSEEREAVFSRNEIRDLLHRFIGYIKACSFYPPGHNRRLTCFDDFIEQGQKLFEQDQRIEFIADAKTLTVNGRAFGLEDAQVASFLPEMIRRNIRSIRIDPKADPFEVNDLARVLIADPPEGASVNSAQKWLFAQGVKRIRIRAFSTNHHSSEVTSCFEPSTAFFETNPLDQQISETKDESTSGDGQETDTPPAWSEEPAATPEFPEDVNPFLYRESNTDSPAGSSRDSYGEVPPVSNHEPNANSPSTVDHETRGNDPQVAYQESRPPPFTEDDSQRWLDELNTHPGIREELERFDEVMKPESATASINKGDLLLAMTSSFLQSNPEATGPDGDAKEAIACGLKTLRVRVTKEAEEEKETSPLEILDRIASTMMRDTDSFFKWLAETDENLDLGAATSMGELMKATFTRSKNGDRSMEFGETELQTLKKPSSREAHETACAKPPGKEATLSDVFKVYVRLKRTVGDRRFDLSLREVGKTHFHVLNDLLLREEDSQARTRIADELNRFLATHLPEADDEKSPFTFEEVEERIFKLKHDDQARIAQTPGIFRRILSELQWGEQRWHGTLTRMARNTPSEFAELLGEWCLKEHASLEIPEIRSLITTSEKAMVAWLDQKTRAQMDGRDADRLAGLALLCRRNTVLPVLERLLKHVSVHLFGKLVRRMIASKEPASIEVIGEELANAEGTRKEKILHLLGDSRLPQAEDLLLESVSNTTLKNDDTKAICAALWSLGRCGTEMSLPALKKIKSNLLFLFSKNNRMIKDHADKAYRAVKNRSKRPVIP